MLKLVSAMAASLTMAAVTLVGATTAHADDAAPQRVTTKDVGLQNLLTCNTYTDGGRTGTAHCSNYTSQVVAFRATIVCGRAWDLKGPWVTLNPGYQASSSNTCDPWSTGVGSVSWEEG
jgi:hypothetical protein